MARGVLFGLALLSFFASKYCKRISLLPGRLTMVPDFVEGCPNATNAIKFTKPVEFKRYGSDVYMDVETKLYRKIDKVEKIIFTINNCRDSNRATCELFQTWRFGEESCSILKQKNAFWSPIFRHITPELGCPLLPGIYSGKNITVDMALLRLLNAPLEKFYWRLQFEAYDYVRILCAHIGVRFMRTRH